MTAFAMQQQHQRRRLFVLKAEVATQCAKSEMDLGHFFTQLNPTHQLTDPTHILANGPTHPLNSQAN